jgi:hypothetical protein
VSLFCNAFISFNIKVILAKCYLILNIKLASIDIVEDKANVNLANINIVKGKAKAKVSNINALLKDNKAIFAKVKLVNNKALFKLINIDIAGDNKGY